MKWKNELEKFGLTNETISHGLRNKIKDYYEMVEGIKELKDSIANPTVNDDVEELQEELSDLQEALQDYDNQLVKAIQIFDKNKDKYAQISKNLGKGRPRKDGQPPKAKEPTPTPTPTPNPTPIVTTTNNSTPNTDENKDGEKKKGNWGLFFGALALGIVTFGLYKSRD
jgi:hypothetical protein